jgi:hypothetical protein
MNKAQNTEQLSCVGVLVRVVFVARKLSMVEEWRNDQNCLGEEITGANVTNQKAVMGSSLGEVIYCNLETFDGRTSIRSTLFVSTRRLQEQRPKI